MDSPLSTYRKEVQDYLRSCEYLLAAMSVPTPSGFSNEELDIVGYYVAELQKTLAVWVKK